MCFKSWFEALDLGTENTKLGNGNYLETALEEEIAVSSHDVLDSLKEDRYQCCPWNWVVAWTSACPDQSCDLCVLLLEIELAVGSTILLSCLRDLSTGAVHYISDF